MKEFSPEGATSVPSLDWVLLLPHPQVLLVPGASPPGHGKLPVGRATQKGDLRPS